MFFIRFLPWLKLTLFVSDWESDNFVRHSGPRRSTVTTVTDSDCRFRKKEWRSEKERRFSHPDWQPSEDQVSAASREDPVTDTCYYILILVKAISGLTSTPDFTAHLHVSPQLSRADLTSSVYFLFFFYIGKSQWFSFKVTLSLKILRWINTSFLFPFALVCWDQRVGEVLEELAASASPVNLCLSVPSMQHCQRLDQRLHLLSEEIRSMVSLMHRDEVKLIHNIHPLSMPVLENALKHVILTYYCSFKVRQRSTEAEWQTLSTISNEALKKSDKHRQMIIYRKCFF